MSYSFLIADDIHLHARNFKPLFRYMEERDVEVLVHETHGDLKKRAGDYRGAVELAAYRERLERLDADALWNYSHAFGPTPIRVFPLCRAEILSYALASQDHWHDHPVPALERPVFDRLHAQSHNLLLDGMAAACFWIDEWREVFARKVPPFSHVFVFSGSFTYGRVLLELASYHRTRAFVLESSLTGHEFYCEERYTPIANRSDIRHPTVRASYHLPADPTDRLRAESRALHRLFERENKNVRQPEGADLPRFPDSSRPTLLVIGQVVNDYSIIEQHGGWLSSIAFYRQLIQRALQQTNYNVIFKGHPWEQKKTHVRRPLTKERLEAFRKSLPPEFAERFAIRNEDNLFLLGRAADRVALLSSQAGIELAFFCGHRPSIFGSAFYGGAGFTDDYTDLERFFDDVGRGRERAFLDLESYDALLRFLTRYLDMHLVSNRGQVGFHQLAKKIEAREIGQARPPGRRGERRGSLSERTLRKLRKLGRDPQAFFRDARLVRTLNEKLR